MDQKPDRRHIPKGYDAGPVAIRMPAAIKAAGAKEAERRGVTLSRLVSESLAREIGLTVPWEESLPESA